VQMRPTTLLNDDPHRDDPIVVLGTAGSGTRVFSDLLEWAGVFMGRRRNPQRDSLDFIEIVKNGMPIADPDAPLSGNYLTEIRSPNFSLKQLTPATRVRVESVSTAFRSAISRDLLPHHEAWGWKESQSMFFLPALKQLFPRMRVVHVIRDGRDMAFSRQQRARYQAAYVQCLTHRANPPDDDDEWPVMVAEAWQTANLGVFRWSSRCLAPSDYIPVRLEALAEDSVEFTKHLYDALGLTAQPSATALNDAGFDPAKLRLGKYRGMRSDLVARIERVAGDALRQFRYVLQ